MAPRPKPERKSIFTEAYWRRPEPKDMGDPNPDMIAQAVGFALSKWEETDQAMALLFMLMTECPTAQSYNAVRRAYGSIESNSGRRGAVEAAAEVYFGPYWANKYVKASLTDITTVVGLASKRRDDIAHGIIWGKIILDGKNYRSFLMPPEYNTGRTHAFWPDTPDPLRLMRAKYRYTASDIAACQNKFRDLRNEIIEYTQLIKREDGRFPALEMALEPLMDRDGKKK
jgi:hypothetical protein